LNAPRVRVGVLVRRQNRVLLCRQEKPGREYWLLPGGGVEGGETLTQALRRELAEELGITEQFPLEGPIAVAESIAPGWRPGDRHILHVVFGADLSHRSLEDVETRDAAVRGARLFEIDELDELVLHPPITRFVQRWRPGDPAIYLGSLWAR
jgi:ADP-ribose pyrophosphatase YjhB (NUDIX family)